MIKNWIEGENPNAPTLVFFRSGQIWWRQGADRLSTRVKRKALSNLALLNENLFSTILFSLTL